MADIEHINQSIKDILLTPIGSRIERRNYGSLLFSLIDQPNDGITRLRVMSATVIALTQWEPRIQLDKVDFQQTEESMTVNITGSRKDKPNESFFSHIQVR